MIQSSQDLNKIFEEINSKTKNKATAYLIGGGALMHYGIKGLTKDIDVAVKTKKEYDSIYKAIKLLGYKETALTEGIKRLNINCALEKEDTRIDLFFDKICGKMSFSKEMAKRAKPIFKGDKLLIKTASLEDIFVFKAITDREGDKNDCEAIIQQNPNWQIILKEITSQAKKGEQIWITYINERLEEFEEKGYQIPIIKQTKNETKKYYKKIEKIFEK